MTVAGRLIVARRLLLVWASLLLVGWASGSLLTSVHPSWDSSAVADLHGDGGGGLTHLMRAITWLGSGVWLDVIFGVAVAVLLLRRSWGELRFLVLASPGTVLLVQILKPLVDRHRPLDPHLTAAGGSSFPSGHTSSSSALYGALLLIWLHGDRTGSPRVRRLVAIAALSVLALIGFSRVYLGVHYPSDVIAAWLIVAVWLTALRGALFTRRVMTPPSG